MFKVIHDYTGDANGCISIKAGDIVSGAQEMERGWLVGRNDTTGETGAFPASYVQTVQNGPPRTDVGCVTSELDQGQARNRYQRLKDTGRKLFKSKRGENKRQKAIFGSLSGIIVAPLLFLVLVYSFDYKHLEAGVIVAISTVLICLGLALSTLCRCILALVIPNFCTGKGRAVFLSIIFGYLLSHPIDDIMNNTREAANTMSCIADIVKNQSKALQRQLVEPASDITNYVVNQKDKFQAITSMIENAFKPVSAVIGKLKNAGDQANEELSRVHEKCELEIKKIQEKWKYILSRASVEIPVKSICVLSENVDVLPTNEIQRELNKTLDYFRVDLSATAHYSGNANTSKSTDQIQVEVMEDLEGKLKVVKILFSFIKKFISLSLALLFLESIWYLRNYLAKDNYENFYITSQFKILDAENEKNGQPHVLPLKAKEKDVYVDTTSVKMASREVGYIKFGLLIVGVHFSLCLLILLFSYSLYYILTLIHTHGSIDINVEGEGDVSVTVEGKGFVADIFRTMLEEIDISEEYAANISISKCLPQPTVPSEADIPILLILYTIALLFVILKAYGMRLRLKIAGYYYPEQQLARVEYLHKRIRHKRVGFLRFIRQQVQSSYKEARVTDRLTFSTWLASHFPCVEQCPCFSEHHARECIGCGVSERPFNNIKLVICEGSDRKCDASYCQVCYPELKDNCPLCSGYQDLVWRE